MKCRKIIIGQRTAIACTLDGCSVSSGRSDGHSVQIINYRKSKNFLAKWKFPFEFGTPCRMLKSNQRKLKKKSAQRPRITFRCLPFERFIEMKSIENDDSINASDISTSNSFHADV